MATAATQTAPETGSKDMKVNNLFASENDCIFDEENESFVIKKVCCIFQPLHSGITGLYGSLCSYANLYQFVLICVHGYLQYMLRFCRICWLVQLMTSMIFLYAD